jgi:predicted nucleotidyltransferase
VTGNAPATPPHLDEVVRRLVAAFEPLTVVLFGSWARGDAGPHSDIDLLVVAPSDEPAWRRMSRAQHALSGLPVAVDVFVCTPDEVERFRKWLGHTVAIALREGRVVHERAA